MKSPVDVALVIVFVVSATGLLLANEDPFARDAVCSHLRLCITSPHADAWNKIFYDLSVGALVSLFFYLLVVRLPDYQRRQRLKRSLRRHYRNFRRNCICTMLMVADGAYSAEMPEELEEQGRFRVYFQEKVAPDRYRWDEFQNKLDRNSLKELLTYMEIFREEAMFVLNNTDVPRDEPFEFLKRLSTAIYSMKNVSTGYDEPKPLVGFLWNVFAGWDPITGYRDEDFVGKMIHRI